jgi:hypothetical protein
MTQPVPPLDDSALFERLRFRGQPLANPDSIVVSGHARFTVLTPRLIRLEWSATGEFEDRSTYAFPTRRAPAPPIAARIEGKTLAIDTGALVLRYVQDSGSFKRDNLSITFELDGEQRTWAPGTPNRSNLRGTRRTLDRCAGDAALEEGLLSRSGWSLFDDSRSVRFDPDEGWVAPRPSHELQDWAFFGHGRDYKGALADYIHFGGPIPLIPRFVLGAWWSRYWAYSSDDLERLVGGFEERGLPLDVLVIDMDWHTPHSWTGYTWNRELFPDPPAFLRWVHAKGLRATLNVHPAEGVQSFEEIYPRFAVAMGVDPDSGETIAFHISDKRFVKNYFELLHHPLEDDGVDFWWLDWQQGEASEMEGLDPLPWLNHLHFADSARRGCRPMLYSRWGGLGNHRYQIGFSGDTYVGWPALQFQPHFTATASNVAYGWWSHDIGGHMGGATEPELYARWVQYGALSPCLRLHATKDPRAERRPWKYPEAVYRAARAAFGWRYQLVPYIYTMARIAHDTGVSLCRPMYYEAPLEDAAYAARYQYFFGDQMIAAPIVHPADPDTGLAATDVWLPAGTWIDYATKETFDGPRWVRLVGDLERMPILAKAGAIVPLAAPFEITSSAQMASGSTDAIPRDRLILSVFPGAQGQFRLYEDDGRTEAYQEGECEWTEIATRVEEADAWEVHIAPVEGTCEALPDQRGYEVRLEGSRRPERVILNGAPGSDWTYDATALRTTVRVPLCDKRQPITLRAVARGGISALGETRNRQVILADVAHLLGDRLPGVEQEDVLLDAVLRTDAPGRADAVARLGGPFCRFIEFAAPEEARQRLGRAIFGAPAGEDEPYDVEIAFTFFRGGKSERSTVRLAGLMGSQIVDAPFAFDGQVLAARWSAEARIDWRGCSLVSTYQSQPLFPAIYAWQAVVYDQSREPLSLEHAMNSQGEINAALDWKAYVQAPETLASIHEPYAIYFVSEYHRELKAGLPLAGYLATTIVSPDEREVVFRFRTAGPVACTLNGQKVEEIVGEDEGELHPLFHKPRVTAAMHLRAGKNRLVVSTQPPRGDGYWFFEGALIAPDGGFMTDLAFELPSWQKL